MEGYVEYENKFPPQSKICRLFLSFFSSLYRINFRRGQGWDFPLSSILTKWASR
jgi:hypothetical protein